MLITYVFIKILTGLMLVTKVTNITISRTCMGDFVITLLLFYNLSMSAVTITENRLHGGFHLQLSSLHAPIILRSLAGTKLMYIHVSNKYRQTLVLLIH